MRFAKYSRRWSTYSGPHALCIYLRARASCSPVARYDREFLMNLPAHDAHDFSFQPAERIWESRDAPASQSKKRELCIPWDRVVPNIDRGDFNFADNRYDIERCTVIWKYRGICVIYGKFRCNAELHNTLILKCAHGIGWRSSFATRVQ